ncbi:MAG: amidohydrolase family protein [Bacteroidales bacterium]|nr:amidohydrolase family protein [Bacteroidales bacterium]
MRRIAAQYVFTAAGKPLRRAVVTAADDGTIVEVEDTGGELKESAGTEFYNGIMIPGLVNCHSHLELSHMRNAIPRGEGLTGFISYMSEQRGAGNGAGRGEVNGAGYGAGRGEIDAAAEIKAAAERADREMHDGGVVACGDISNESVSFDVKSRSSIRYLTFAEVFGIDPLVADARMSGVLKVAEAARESLLPAYITPHAVYSMSDRLFTLVREHITPGSVISLHFLESDDERKMAHDHVETALGLSRLASHLILVHNTVITRAEAEKLAGEGNTWFCLCPSSNLHITGAMPPVALLREVTDRIVAGTDSLASNDRLDMLAELRLLHEAAPGIPLGEVIRWGTINGARALKMSDTLGSIEPGKKPGLLLIENADLVNLRLLPVSRVRRLL